METHLDHIDEYLRGKLSEKECREFEKRLLDDPELKQMFEQRKMLVMGIRYNTRLGIRAMQKEQWKEYSQEKRIKKIVVRGVAAVIIMFFLGIGIGYWIRPLFETTDPEQAATPQKPPIAIVPDAAQEGSKEDIEVGAPPSQYLLSNEITHRILTIQNGKREESAALAPIQLEVIKDKAGSHTSVFTTQKLKIYSSEGDGFRDREMEVIELRQDEMETRFYLKTGATYYQIYPEGKSHELVAESDYATLRTLMGKEF